MDETQQIVAEELEQLAGYREIYINSGNPLPIRQIAQKVNARRVVVEETPKEERTFWRIMGLDASFFLISAIAGAIYAAIRTSGVFAGAERKLLLEFGFPDIVVNLIAGLAAICLLLAVEGYLGAYGFKRGRRSGKIEVSKTETLMGVITNPAIGVVLTLIISGLAGIVSGSPLLPKDNVWVDTFNIITGILVFISGPGISYLVFLCTENVGIMVNKYEMIVKEMHDEYIALQNKYNAEFDAAEEKNYDEYITLQKGYDDVFRIEMREWQDGFEFDYRQKGRQLMFGKERFVITRQKGGGTFEQTPAPVAQGFVGTQKKVERWLSQNGMTAYDIGPGLTKQPMNIAAALARENGNYDPATPDEDIQISPTLLSAVRTALTRIRQNTPPTTQP